MSGALVRRYRALPTSREGRLQAARELCSDPAPLVQELLAAALEPPGGRLCGAGRLLVRELSEVADGVRAPTAADFAFWLAREGGLSVAGEPLLDCSYVDRELSLRAPGLGRLRLDLLLASAYDRAPVLAEVKLGSDKDPFAALIQLLACMSLFVGGDGRPSAGGTDGPELAGGAVDGMVLLVEPRWRARGWIESLEAARELGRAVTAGAASALVRRISFLSVSRQAGGLWVDAERV